MKSPFPCVLAKAAHPCFLFRFFIKRSISKIKYVAKEIPMEKQINPTQIFPFGLADGKKNKSNKNIPFRIGRWKNQLINSERYEKNPSKHERQKNEARMPCR